MAGLSVVEGEAAPDQAPESQATEDIKQLVQEHGSEGERVLALMFKAWKQGNIVVPGSLRPSAARFESAWPAYNIRRTLGDYPWDKLKMSDGRDLPHVREFYRASSGNLNLGKRKRTGERTWSQYLADNETKKLKINFRCQEEGCGEKFHFKQDFVQHQVSHGGGDFRCQEKGCGKAFADSRDLTVHMRTHTGERPFRCQHQGCGKAYKRKHNLTRHMRKNHSDG